MNPGFPFSRILLLLLAALLLARPLMAAEEAKEGEEGAEARPKAVYVDLAPPFVTNYGSPARGHHYIQARITLRVEGPDAEEKIEFHKAPLRHNLVMLLSGIPRGEADTPEQREVIRKKALKVVQETMKELEPEIEVKDLLFTSFVIQ
ncbi:MAG: flagellar basal body-associated protein FliL [Gammaproteobacteria bacterium]|nr:MAG: flagellar basal body-associated protein FliL [Gammaproteobacteria bacterium]